MEEVEAEELSCAAKNEGYDAARFALVVYVGTPIAVLGVLCNALLLRLFSTSRSLQSPAFYLLVLAFLDLLIDLIYIPFFTIDALAIYGQDEVLFHAYHSYVLYLYGGSRMVQFASTYMVLMATIERFVVVSELTIRGRFLTVFVVLSTVFLLRLPAFFDYYVDFYPHCPTFEDYEFQPLLTRWEFYRTFNFFATVVFQTFVPFVLLLVLNISIVTVTKRRMKGIGWATATFIDMPQITELIRKESINSNKRKREELKKATWTMVCIVTSYLCCACFSVFITVMEQAFPDSPLLFNEDGSSTRFYTYTADLVSILVALNSLLRLFIYLICNPQLRKDLLTVRLSLLQRKLQMCGCTELEENTTTAKISRPATFGILGLPSGHGLVGGKAEEL